MLAQILLTLGEVKTDIAVIKDRQSVLPDHETRLRHLESVRPGRGWWLRDVAMLVPMYGLVIDLIVRMPR